MARLMCSTALVAGLAVGFAPMSLVSSARAAEVVSVVQDAEAAKAVLSASQEAMAALTGLEANLTFEGLGNAQIAELTPGGTASFRMVKTDDADIPFAARIEGEMRDRAAADPYQVDLYLSQREIGWTDFDAKVRNVRSTRMQHSQSLKSSYLLIPHEYFLADPYGEAMRGEPKLLERAEVGGVMCDVVEFDAGSGGRNARPGVSNTQRVGGLARWYIGVDDKLPRKIERVNGPAGFQIAMTQTLTDVKAGIDISAESLAFTEGGGFTLDRAVQDTLRQPEPINDEDRTRQVDKEPAPIDREASRPSAVAGQAPDFELRTNGGDVVTKASTAGRVSVMYFWGTWCVPCRAYSPMISELVTEFESEGLAADVYGVAVRERDLSAPFEYANKNGYNHTVLVSSKDDSDTAYAAARAFKVRIYPSIAIVGTGGELLAMIPSKGPGDAANGVIDEVRQTVRDHLGLGG